jgi:hypothetical protein
MLEYWWQVELFRRPPSGARNVGDFELPYRTDAAHRSPKLMVKWSDLVLLSESGDALIVELKDLGRAPGTTMKNAEGVGFDLAALARMRQEDTVPALSHQDPSRWAWKEAFGEASAPPRNSLRRGALL